MLRCLGGPTPQRFGGQFGPNHPHTWVHRKAEAPFARGNGWAAPLLTCVFEEYFPPHTSETFPFLTGYVPATL